MPDSEQPAGGLFRSARRLLSSGIDAVQSRIELVKAELDREKEHWISIIARAVVGAVLVVSALNILVVAAAVHWRENAGAILGVAGVVYLLVGVWLWLSIKGEMKRHDSFGNIKEVLKRDKKAIDPDS
jgi:uncharacterized membrane protein YqjE